MKQKIMTYVLSILISGILGSIGFIAAGCKTRDKIQIIQPQYTTTSNTSTKAFNDETYVWEEFIFSTNQVKDVAK